MNEYDVIKKPLVTEKGTVLRERENKYVFSVDCRATKADIRRAVEKLFGVKVDSVNVANFRGKRKRVGRNVGMTSNWKKAIVKLKEGNSIELFEGV